jgi:hypothetical protein
MAFGALDRLESTVKGWLVLINGFPLRKVLSTGRRYRRQKGGGRRSPYENGKDFATAIGVGFKVEYSGDGGR